MGKAADRPLGRGPNGPHPILQIAEGTPCMIGLKLCRIKVPGDFPAVDAAVFIAGHPTPKADDDQPLGAKAKKRPSTCAGRCDAHIGPCIHTFLPLKRVAGGLREWHPRGKRVGEFAVMSDLQWSGFNASVSDPVRALLRTYCNSTERPQTLFCQGEQFRVIRIYEYISMLYKYSNSKIVIFGGNFS